MFPMSTFYSSIIASFLSFSTWFTDVKDILVYLDMPWLKDSSFLVIMMCIHDETRFSLRRLSC